MSKCSVVARLVLTTVILGSISFAATSDRVVGVVSNGQTATLRGNIHPMARTEFDQGPVDPAMQLGTITLIATPTAAQQQALNLLLAQQQDRKSANYHKWLTPEQYADRFGLSKADIAQIASWLASEGFTSIHPARGRNWISFSGSAAQVESAFGTEIHHYSVNGQLHYANRTAPKVPVAIAGIVTGLRGLHDFLPHPMNQKRLRPNWHSSSVGDFVAPGDISTIYDIGALYTAGIDGTGQKIAIMGQTDVHLADLNDFRSGFGLSTYTCTTNASDVIMSCNDPHFKYVLSGTDPGVSTRGDLGEADLDLEWSGAVAKGAQIIYVNSTNTFNSFYVAIDNNYAPVISLSYGECEFNDIYINSAQGSGQALSNEAELQKANALGITFVNSSGDSGAAECDFFQTVTSTNLATQGLAVSYPASSPEVTGVGGTATPLADWDNPTFWGPTNSANGGSALSYVPEQTWNDDLEIGQFCQQSAGNLFCSQGGSTKVPGWVAITNEATAQTDIGISSSGGGASNCQTENGALTACVSGFAKPSWQTVTVAGAGSVRLSPDISFLASPNFPGYVFCTTLSELGVNSSSSSCAGGITQAVDTYLSIIGGTSASAPVFAGMVALLNQKTGTTQGNINPSLYFLAATAPGAFHDTTSGDNKVSCQAGTPGAPQLTSLFCPSTGVLGYNASTGFDLTTGLGSLDLNNFAVALAAPPDFTASSPTTTLSVFSGQSGTATITVVPVNNFTGSVSFACSGLPSGSTCSFSPTTVTPPTTTQTTATITGSGAGGSSTVAITASTGILSQVSHPAASIALTVAPAFTLTPSAATYQVAQGSAVDATVTVALATGFTGTITFTCTDSASLSVCTVPPATNASGDVSFHITTTAPTAKLDRPMDRGSRIFYAALMPGLLGLFFTFGSKKRAHNAMRLLGLIAVLSVSTLWMASCGGSGGGGTTSNPGTPKGTYTITVGGASGGSTASTSFQLIVQ